MQVALWIMRGGFHLLELVLGAIIISIALTWNEERARRCKRESCSNLEGAGCVRAEVGGVQVPRGFRKERLNKLHICPFYR